VAPAPVASLSRGDVSPRAAALLFSTDSAEAGGELEIEINDVTRENLKRQMLYRSQQRGWLELDLVMGQWAEKHLKDMDDDMMREYWKLLGVENPDLFKWLTGQLEAPADIAENPTYQKIFKEVQAKINLAGENSRNLSGKPWLRGWDDKK